MRELSPNVACLTINQNVLTMYHTIKQTRNVDSSSVVRYFALTKMPPVQKSIEYWRGWIMRKIYKIPMRKHAYYYIQHHDVLFEDCITKGMDNLLAIIYDLFSRRQK